MSSHEAPSQRETKLAKATLRAGEQLGQYRVEELVGRGSMGCVYRAVHERLQRPVALKCMDARSLPCPVAAARFAREAQVIAAMQHPHIVQVFDAGESDDGLQWLAMEYLHGHDLAAVLEREACLEEAHALEILRQILTGLAYAHRAGVVHRDLKPGNIFLCDKPQSPTVRILDFGVSKLLTSVETGSQLTQRGSIVGTPEFMAPEQAQGLEDVDGRADLYAATAILFACLTGRPPHQHPSFEGLIVTICMTDAPDLQTLRPATSPALAQFVRRGLARNPRERFADADEMLAAMAALEQEATAPPSHSAPQTKPAEANEGASSMVDIVPATASASETYRTAESRGSARISTSATALLVAFALGGLVAWKNLKRRPPAVYEDLPAATATSQLVDPETSLSQRPQRAPKLEQGETATPHSPANSTSIGSRNQAPKAPNVDAMAQPPTTPKRKPKPSQRQKAPSQGIARPLEPKTQKPAVPPDKLELLHR